MNKPHDTLPDTARQGSRLARIFADNLGSEDIARRQENVKHYRLGQNCHQAVIFSDPIHFREDDSGAWLDIDNTLDEALDARGKPVLRNRANSLHAEFPREASYGQMVSVTCRGRTLSLWLEHANGSCPAQVRDGEQLAQARFAKPIEMGLTTPTCMRPADIARLTCENLYENAALGVSVRYTLCSDYLKADIILADSSALENAALHLPDDFAYTLEDENALRIADRESGDALFSLYTPIAYDAEGKETDVRMALTAYPDHTRLDFSVDPTFLQSAAYPVTIDPIINSSNALKNIQNTTLCEGSNVKPYTQTYVKVGKESSKRRVGLLKLNKLAKLSSSDTVIAAVLQMAPKSSSSSRYVAMYEVLAPWAQENVNWLTFDPDDISNISPDAQECREGSSSSWLNFDLTNLYRKWCTKTNGVSNNNGVALRTPAHISGDNYSELYSSKASSAYRPMMYVNYVSHAGLEDWWQYEQMSAERAGTVHADLFNGNMVLSHSDTLMTGNRVPISISHHYNSCLSANNAYNCGYGWKTTAHQKITARTHGDRDYYVWEDGDGTEHFFEKTAAQPYKDSEGMQLKMTFNSAEGYFIIADKQHNQLRFDVVQSGLAWLKRMRDACGSTALYTYVNGYQAQGRIDRITDPVGRETVFSYSGNLLSSIRVPAEAASSYRYVYFTYDGANRLIGVRYSELGTTGINTTYGYDGDRNLLTWARNYNGVQVGIGYEPRELYDESAFDTEVTDQMRRVLSLETVATNASGIVTQYGAKQLFTYKPMCTEVTAVEEATSNAGKKLYYQFNDAGNVVCIRDDLGFAQFTKFDHSLDNKPSETSPLRKAVVNLLRSPDLNGNWTTSGTAMKDRTNTCLSVPSAKLIAVSSGESRYRQEVTLEPNTKYVLSAYVKTSAVVGASGVFLRLGNAGTPSESVCSDALFGTTDAAIGNDVPTDGWERVHVDLNHTASTAQVYYVDLVIAADSGTAWFACPQLETGEIVNTVNLVSNGDFRYTYTSAAQTLAHEWTQGSNNLATAPSGVFTPDEDLEFPSALSGNYIQVEGRPNQTQVGYVQSFDMIGSKGDVFVVGGWAKAKSIPNAKTIGRGFGIAMRLKKKSDGTWIDYVMKPFNGEWVGWQFGCWALVAGYDYVTMEITLTYTKNCDLAKFSNVFLYREQFGQSFAYDEDGDVVSIGGLSGQTSDVQYDSEKNITKYTQPGRDKSVEDNQHWLYYGDNDENKKKHLLLRSRTPMHITDYHSYDSNGNTLSNRRVDYRVYTGGIAENVYPYIRTEKTYAADGNHVATQKDARGYVITQAVNANTGTLTSVTDSANQTVNYTYDDFKRVTQAQTAGDGKTYKINYAYEDDRIQAVAHNTTSDTASDVTYAFDYDDLGRKTTVTVGTQALSENLYENTRNALLSGVLYGNGDNTKYAYDEYDRLTGVKYDSETQVRYVYAYGANGQAAEVKDANLGRTMKTEYDLSDRPCQMEIRHTQTNNLLYKARLRYDKLGNLNQFAEKIGNDVHASQYTYDRDNRVTGITYDGGPHRVGYTYDNLGRVGTRVVACGVAIGKLTSAYEYVAGGYGANSTTPLVASISQNGVSFSYAYDNCGNIVSETRGTLTTTYAYDVLGQLTRVNDPHENATWIFHYDRGGNITSKERYAYTTGTTGTVLQTVSYSYTDGNWKDKLTGCNATPIIYDAIGNPLNDGMWSYAWEVGHQLRQMSKNGMTIQYKYDHNGLRVGKTVNGTETKFTLHGDLIVHMTQGTNILHFFYDAQSRPTIVDFNGTLYTYIHDLQGDIVGLLDSNGALVVEYKYDAWGRKLSVTGSLAATLGTLNPFRYRGYVFDEETALYYLRNRYYNAEQGRFINADMQLNLRGFGLNVFSYCGCNPVVRIDVSGFAWYNNVWDWTKQTASDTWDWTKQAAIDGWNWAVQATSDAWDWTKQAATDAWNWLSQAMSDAWDWTSQTISDAWDWAKHAISSIGDWMRTTKDAAIGWVKNAAQQAKSFLGKKTVMVVKGLAAFGWGMFKGMGAVMIAITVNAVPLPLISQAASLGYAAKAGYHLGNAYRNLRNVVNALFS